MTDDTTKRRSGRKARPRWVLMSIAGALALVIGGMTWSAVAYSGKFWDSDKIERFVEWRVDDMLAEVEATVDQRDQVHAIVTAAIADMGEFREFKCERVEARLDALTKETVDCAEREALLRQKLDVADRASQRLFVALADAADVLTPDQRIELAEDWASRDWHDRGALRLGRAPGRDRLSFSLEAVPPWPFRTERRKA